MTRFERLSSLRDHTVDKHQVDPRGWRVVNLEGRTLGHVEDVIVDMDTMKGIYLDIELDAKLFSLRRDPRVLVPFERADRQPDRKRLQVSSLDAARVQELVSERDRGYIDVWDRLWQRQLTADELRAALDNARPGEQVRIPIMNEEIVVERRPLVRADDTPTPSVVEPTPVERMPTVTER